MFSEINSFWNTQNNEQIIHVLPNLRRHNKNTCA